MNERVYELIRLSAVPVDQADDYTLAKGFIEPAEKLDVAKFAELIVRECASIASNPAPGCHSSFGKIILEHFGVEE